MGRQWTGIIGAVGVLVGTACPVFAAPNPFLQQEQLQQARQEQRKRMERLANPGERQPAEQKVPEVELPSSPIRFQVDIEGENLHNTGLVTADRKASLKGQQIVNEAGGRIYGDNISLRAHQVINLFLPAAPVGPGQSAQTAGRRFL